MVPSKALHIAQIQKAQAKTPRPAVAGQFHKSFRNLGILVAQFTLISITAFTDAERPAG